MEWWRNLLGSQLRLWMSFASSWTPTDVHDFALAKEAQRPTGSVYVILPRLEDAGWVESYWEVGNQQQ